MPEPRSRIGILLFTLLVASAVLGILSPYLAEAVIPTKTTASGKGLKILPTQGFTKFASVAKFTAYTRAATGINVFNNLLVGTGGTAFVTLGLCSDTLGTNVTLVSTRMYDVTYAASGAGTQRLTYSRFTAPESVTGGTYAYNPVSGVLTVTTAGASTVKVNWAPPSKVISTGWGEALGFLPLVFLLFVLSMWVLPDNRGALLQLAFVIAIVSAVIWMLYGAGV